MKDFVVLSGLGKRRQLIKHDGLYHVMAKTDVKQGELIERCPMIKLEHKSKYITDPQILKYSIVEPSNDLEETKKHGYDLWVMLGDGSYYERSENPDLLRAYFDFKFDKEYVDILAIKDIAKNSNIIVGNIPKTASPKPSHNNPVVRSTDPEPELTDDEFMESMKALLEANS
jgi:hypothetical protein|tara:strand:+ start:3890 stop:4405 length:516 start_codon:yes stop_codon:yes gene_type:complete